MQQYAGIDFDLPPFAQKLIERGELKAKREALLKVVARAGLALSAEQRARVDDCREPDALDRWFDRALVAKAADELFD